MTGSAGRWARLPLSWSHPLLVPIVIAGIALAGGIAVPLVGPALVVLPVALVAVIWAAIRAPGVLLAAYLLVPFYKATLGPLVPVDLTLILAAINGLQIFILIGGGVRLRGSGVGLALWIVLGMVVLAAVTWAGDPQLGLDRAVLWWLLILIPSGAAIRVGSDPRFVDQFLATIFSVGTIVVLLGFPGSFSVERLTLFGEDTIQTGRIALIVVLLAVAWFMRVAPRGLGLLAALVVPIALIESIAAGSRGPILAFGVVVAVEIIRRLLSRRTISKQDVGFLALGAAGAVALVLTVSRLPGASVARLLLFGGAADTSTGARVDLFTTAIAMFTERPLLGYGTGGFEAFARTHGLAAFTYPHNILLQFGSEMGLVGVAVFVALVVIALTRHLPAEPRWRTIRALFLFMLINGLVSGDIYGDRLLWGLLVILLACPVAIRDASRSRGAAHGVTFATETAHGV